MGVFSYSLDKIDDVQALALDNKSELDKRLANAERIPVIENKIDEINNNVIKLCTLQGFDC